MPDSGLKAFYDTNTLLYLISEDASKARVVDTLLQRRGVISVQVLNEFTNIAQRKHGLAIADIRAVLHDVRATVDIVPVTLEIHELGLKLIERHRFSTYDAMIVAAALGAGCEMLYSEDMHHGLVVDRQLTIRDPFRAS